jgi:DNA-binding transcriptional LysR family regulator
MRKIPLKALHTFETVARHNNFNAAAAELFITPSAISHQIKNLEQWLGQPLFKRKGNQLQLLPQGKTLAHHLSQSFSEISLACLQAQTVSSSQQLTIAALPSLATCWLIPKLTDFQQQFPDIKLNLSYAMHGTDIDFNKVDIAFVFAQTTPAIKGIEAQFFLSGKSYPVCSKDFLDKKGGADKLKISQGPFLHDAARVDHWQQWLLENSQPIVLAKRGSSFDDFNLLRAAALSGHGIALCPLALIAQDISEDKLIKLDTNCSKDNYNYYFLKKIQTTSALKTVIDLFQGWISLENSH